MKVAYRLIASLLASASALSLAAAAPLLIPIVQRSDEPAPAGGARDDDKKPQEVLIRADQMTYDANTSVVTAEGNVEVTYGPRTLLADKLSYDQKTRVVIAEGNATIREPGG